MIHSLSTATTHNTPVYKIKILTPLVRKLFCFPLLLVNIYFISLMEQLLFNTKFSYLSKKKIKKILAPLTITRENLISSYSPNKKRNSSRSLNFPNIFPRKDDVERISQLIIKRMNVKIPIHLQLSSHMIPFPKEYWILSYEGNLPLILTPNHLEQLVIILRDLSKFVLLVRHPTGAMRSSDVCFIRSFGDCELDLVAHSPNFQIFTFPLEKRVIW